MEEPDRLSALQPLLQRLILSRPNLRTQEIFGTVPRVSKALRAAAADLGDPHCLEVTITTEAQAEQLSSWVREHGQTIDQLTVSLGRPMLEEQTEHAHRRWFELWHNLQTSSPAFPQLQQLTICRTPADRDRPIYSSVPHDVMSDMLLKPVRCAPQQTLQTLNLTRDPQDGACEVTPFRLLVAAVDVFTNLTSLKQLQFACLGDFGLNITDLDKLTMLTRLVVLDPDTGGLHRNAGVVDLLSGLPSLRHLSLRLHNTLAGDFNAALSRLTHLTSLYISVTDRHRVPRAKLVGLKNLKHLQNLTLECHPFYLDSHLSNLTTLRGLGYKMLCCWDDPNMEIFLAPTLLQPLSALTRLSWEFYIPSPSLWATLAALRNLQSLSLSASGTYEPVPAGDQMSLLTTLTAVTQLQCTLLDFRWQSWAASLAVLSDLSRLRHLKLYDCGLELEHVSKIVTVLTRMTYLGLGPSYDSELPCNLVLPALTQLKELQQLNLQGLLRVGDEEILEGLPELERLRRGELRGRANLLARN